MADRDEIQALQVGYAEKFDARDAEAFANLFTDNGVMVPPGMREIVGREKLIKAVRNMPPGGTHYPQEVEIEINGHEAIASCRYLAEMPDGSQHQGSYKDKYLRTSKGWRILRREVLPDSTK